MVTLRRRVSKGLNLMRHSAEIERPSAPNSQTLLVAMQGQNIGRHITVYFAWAICALIQFSIPGLAQNSATPLPTNAHAKTYGQGWECDRGYRKDGVSCVTIVLPENSYLTNQTYGLGWECLHGFRKVGGSTCEEVVVPDGGFLGPSGKRWYCLRGHQKLDQTCQKIVLPDNAFITETSRGSDWRCNRGYEVVNNACSKIAVPENAYLSTASYGRAWTCERGFIEQDGGCKAVIIPANAYFDDATYGPGWNCDRGYSASNDKCEAIKMPAHAHLDRTGNRWECHRNFQKSKGLCVLNN